MKLLLHCIQEMNRFVVFPDTETRDSVDGSKVDITIEVAGGYQLKAITPAHPDPWPVERLFLRLEALDHEEDPSA